ncbi:MAG: porin family protein [Gemmatimonadetes bacterium]|nr:porin family protein [Gemmatimonadota bacterium]
MKQGISQGLIAVVLGLVLLTTPASAQIKWGLGIGPTVPMGTFADGFKTGFHAVGIANFDLTAKPISFRTDAVYNVNKCDVAGCGDITANTLTLSGDVVYNFPTPSAHPYLLGGVTWGHLSCSGNDCAGAQSESDFGFNVGGGLHFDLGPTKAFIEARYFGIGGNVDAHLIPISFGIRF